MIVLAGVFLFFFCFNGYLSQYVLLLTLALPLVSLLVSLPGALGIRLLFSAERPAVRKGSATSLLLTVDNRLPFASGRARVTLTVENTLTGESQRERFVFTAGRKPLVITHQLTSPSCGQVVCRLSQGWVCDYMGLFCLPLRISRSAQQCVLFFPAVYHPSLLAEQTSIPDGEGERYSQAKPGNDPSELFSLRKYREGDRLSQIHWKLSKKSGELLVREFSLPVSDHLFFLLEPNGTGVEIDALLDAFATLSNFLIDREIAHRAGFQGDASGGLSLQEITKPEELLSVLASLSTAEPQPILPAFWEQRLPAGVSHALYLCCHPSKNSIGGLKAQMPSARISVLTAGDTAALEDGLPDSVELVPVKPGSLPEALDGFCL